MSTIITHSPYTLPQSHAYKAGGTDGADGSEVQRFRGSLDCWLWSICEKWEGDSKATPLNLGAVSRSDLTTVMGGH